MVWLDKLDSMHTILVSQDDADMLKQKDPFEEEFKELREKIKDTRELMDERHEKIQEAKSEYKADAEQLQLRTQITT